MRRVLAVLLTLVAGVAVSTALARPAVARTVGSIEFTVVTPRVDVGMGPTFRYTTHSLGDASTISLQRYTGTVWKTLSSPPKGANLTVKAPALGFLGKYVYRMASSTGVVSPVRFVYAFANVSMAAICPHTGSDQQFPRVCTKKTTHVGNTTLVSSMSIGAVKFPNFFAGANLPNPSCRSASLRFTTNANSTYKSYLKISQGNGIPVVRGQATAGVAHIGTLNVTLTLGKVYFNGSTDAPTGGSLFIAGTLSCWTTTGRS